MTLPVSLRRAALLAAAAALTLTGAPAHADPGVTPAAVEQAANPGASFDIKKTVTTPEVPPIPDVVLAIDTTGSMGPAIANVQANLGEAIADLKAAQPSLQGAVVSYKDETDGGALFTVHQGLTGDEAALQVAVDSLTASGGGDEPEGWLNALYEISNGAVTYRDGSSRIVVLIGDAASHDPSNGHSLADATAALQADGARVLAVAVDTGGAGLDATGQASSVTAATGGALVGGTADEVTAAILAGLKNLDVKVAPQVVSCDPGLSVTFDKNEITVASGTSVEYMETVHVAADAAQGATLGCTVRFLLNGEPAGDSFTQTIRVPVNDVTPPTGGCVLGPNPSGKTVPAAEAGFRTVTGADNVDAAVDVFVKDSGSAAVFGPYPSGTDFKFTQAPGATPSAVPFEGVVEWHITLNGDPLIEVVDDAGNRTSLACPPVPPKKK